MESEGRLDPEPTNRSRRRCAAALGSVLAAAALLALAYQRAIPVFEAPDEPSHVEYVAFLLDAGRLPRYGALPDVIAEGMQPPLYYLVAAPLLACVEPDAGGLRARLRRANAWIYGASAPPAPESAELAPHPVQDRHRQLRKFAVNRDFEHLRPVRFASLLFGLLATALTFAAARRATGSTPLAALAAGLLGFTPQFVFLSAYVGNDTASTAVGAAALALVAAAVTRPPARRHYLSAGALVAVALVTKLSSLPVVAVAAIAVPLVDPRPARLRLRDAGFGAAVSLVAAPYLYWSFQHRGGLLGFGAVEASAARLMTPDDQGGLARYFLARYVEMTFASYWGQFGWATLTIPRPLLYAIALGVLAAVAGWLAEPGRSELRDPRLRRFGGILLASFLAILAAHVWLNLRYAQPQGRHLYAAAPHIATLLAIGASRWLGGGPRSLQPLAVAIALCVWAGVAVYCLVAVLARDYA